MKETVVVFQGDSITDCGRPHELEAKSYDESLGNGYVKILAGRMPMAMPDQRWRMINRGVSGNKVTQLLGRWQTHTINLKPDMLSILVGVNDVWHGLPEEGKEFNGVAPIPFERVYRMLLDFTLLELPEVRLVLGVPFLLQGRAWTEAFQEGVEARQDIVRRLAAEYDAVLVEYPAAFERALTHVTVEDLAPDGVHPTNLGNTVMADAWLAAVVPV